MSVRTRSTRDLAAICSGGVGSAASSSRGRSRGTCDGGAVRATARRLGGRGRVWRGGGRGAGGGGRRARAGRPAAGGAGGRGGARFFLPVPDHGEHGSLATPSFP